MDNRAFRTPAEVKEFFIFNLSNSPTPHNVKTALAGIVVDSKLRKEIMTHLDADRVIVNGRVREFEFENLKGGVWRCKLKE